MHRQVVPHRLLRGCMLAVVGWLSLAAAQTKLPWPNVGEDPSVTPVSGPSWLTHLGIALNRTSLGQGAELGDPFNYKVIVDTLLLGLKTVCATVVICYPLALIYMDLPARRQ